MPSILFRTVLKVLAMSDNVNTSETARSPEATPGVKEA